jgi:hypothetical protein
MRTNSIYKQGTNTSVRNHYHGDSVSDGSSSAASSNNLRKLASLEIGSVATRSVNGKPVIDLTHVSNVSDFGAQQNPKYIITVHDEMVGTGSEYSAPSTARRPTARNTNHHGQPSSVASSLDYYGGYKTFHEVNRIAKSSRATFHRSGTSKKSNDSKLVQDSDSPSAAEGEARRKNEFKTRHHNGTNITQAAQARATDYPQAERAKMHTQPKKAQDQPQRASVHPPQPQRMLVQTLAKIPNKSKAEKSKSPKKKTILGSLFQCVNPTVPGEEDVPMKAQSQLGAMNALRSNEDALDSVFNTMERFSCRDDSSTMTRETRRGDDTRHDPPYGFQPGTTSINSIMTETGKRLAHTQKSATIHRAEEKDILDSVFEGVEKFACRDDQNTAHFNYVSEEKDAKFASSNRQNRAMTMWSLKKAQDPPAIGAKRSQLEKKDMLDKFGSNFERAMCTSQAAYIGYEGDVIDGVFEKLEPTTCRGKQFVESDGGYYDTSVYDLDLQNSMVASRSIEESTEWQDVPRNDSMRRPSCGNGQPQRNQRNSTPPGRDVLDYVFENVERGVCRPEEHTGISGSARARVGNGYDQIADSKRY